MNKLVVTIFILLILITGFFLLRADDEDSTSVSENNGRDEGGAPPPNVDFGDEVVVETEEGVDEVMIVSENFSFIPNQITLNKGVPARLIFENDGVHTFTVDELGIDENLDQGEVVFEFTPEKTGTFEFYCSIPGHRAAGMTGTITIVDSEKVE